MKFREKVREGKDIAERDRGIGRLECLVVRVIIIFLLMIVKKKSTKKM